MNFSCRLWNCILKEELVLPPPAFFFFFFFLPFPHLNVLLGLRRPMNTQSFLLRLSLD